LFPALTILRPTIFAADDFAADHFAAMGLVCPWFGRSQTRPDHRAAGNNPLLPLR
jgi:hypothetical protein